MNQNKTIFVTGSARRLGREIAISLAKAGFSLVIHSSCKTEESIQTLADVSKFDPNVSHIAADFTNPQLAVGIFSNLFNSCDSLFALVNNAALFEGGSFLQSTINEWDRNLAVNLTVPYLLSQYFAKALAGKPGRIINILDWRALRPGKDHFAYTISKAALASMTQAMALALAPNITVNGLALGAILPPSDGGYSDSIIQPVPAARWAAINEVTDTVHFLMTGPAYITGEIIHIDGGRHLV